MNDCPNGTQPMTRKDYASVFTVILLTTWLAAGVFGDHNTYVVSKDGSKWVKDRATPVIRVIDGALVAFPFSLLNVAVLWIVSRSTQRRSD